jgi:hypothetical protein
MMLTVYSNTEYVTGGGPRLEYSIEHYPYVL